MSNTRINLYTTVANRPAAQAFVSVLDGGPPEVYFRSLAYSPTSTSEPEYWVCSSDWTDEQRADIEAEASSESPCIEMEVVLSGGPRDAADAYMLLKGLVPWDPPDDGG